MNQDSVEQFPPMSLAEATLAQYDEHVMARAAKQKQFAEQLVKDNSIYDDDEERPQTADSRTDQALEQAEDAIKLAMHSVAQARSTREAEKHEAQRHGLKAMGHTRGTFIYEVPGDAPIELTMLANLISVRAHELDLYRNVSPATEEDLKKLQLTALTEFINEARDIRRGLVVLFVKSGYISRKQAGEILGVHQGTIAEWVKQDTPITPPKHEAIGDDNPQPQ